MTTGGFDALFSSARVMAILRGYGPVRTLELARRAWSVGISCIEVPLQSDDDAESLARLAAVAEPHGYPVGAGTILDPAAAERARELGAQFTVSPGFDADVARASIELRMPHLPGVATPSDVHNVRRLGLRWVKAFPAAELGPAWITAVRAPFPDMRFVATGGISSHNAASFLDGGASAVAVGSALDDPAQLDALAALAR